MYFAQSTSLGMGELGGRLELEQLELKLLADNFFSSQRICFQVLELQLILI